MKPVAISRIPLEIFRQCNEHAAKQDWHYFRVATAVQKRVNKTSESCEKMSARCSGRTPSGPPEEPVGKDFTALRTSASSTKRLAVSDGSGRSCLAAAAGFVDSFLTNWSGFLVGTKQSECCSLLPSSNFAAIAPDRRRGELCSGGTESTVE